MVRFFLSLSPGEHAGACCDRFCVAGIGLVDGCSWGIMFTLDNFVNPYLVVVQRSKEVIF